MTYLRSNILLHALRILLRVPQKYFTCDRDPWPNKTGKNCRK